LLSLLLLCSSLSIPSLCFFRDKSHCWLAACHQSAMASCET
jgi:hypothetical protein